MERTETPSLARDPGPPWTAVVLVHYGDPALVRRCLQSLAAHETGPHRAVVVDHGPGPGLPEALAGAHPQVTILSAHHNPGFGAGCNLGAREALAQGASGLWFLNPDALVGGPMLGSLWHLADAHPQIGLWGTHQVEGTRRLGADHQPPWFARGLPSISAQSLPGARLLGPAETLSGASIFLTRAAWDAVGPWPEWCFLYWEDAAWCRQACLQGLGLALTDLAVIHSRGTTTGRHSANTLYYGARNMLLLHRQILPSARGGRLLLALHLLQKRLFRGQWAYLGATFKGILDALRTPPLVGRRTF